MRGKHDALTVAVPRSPAPTAPPNTPAASSERDDAGLDKAGYIKVGVRLRPVADDRGACTKLKVDAEKGEIQIDGRTGPESKFKFASVFADGEDNQELFVKVGRPLVESVMVGYNSTLFAYGQTGSGKTFTIGEISKLGTPVEGVAHRMIRALYLFAKQEQAASAMEYTFSVQYLQIHCEKIFDLLAERATDQLGEARDVALSLREDKETGVYVDGAVSIPATTTDACLDLLRKGADPNSSDGMLFFLPLPFSLIE